jgi:hypothetical protein
MSRTLTSADRSALIKLASTLPVDSAERKAILAGLSAVSGKTATIVTKGSIAADYARGKDTVGLIEFRKAVRKYALVKAREFAHVSNAGVDPYSAEAEGSGAYLIDDLFIAGSSVHGNSMVFDIQDGQSSLTVSLNLGMYEIDPS